MTDTPDPTCPPAHLQHGIAVLRRHAFSALLADGTPSLADLAEAASRDAVGVAQAIAWLEATGALERAGDRLVGAHGLTRRPTPHTITIGDRTLHTWCAFDAVAIPVALAASARATTTCPSCNRALFVDVRDGNLPDHSDLVLWLPGGECRNVIADFCAHANLFCRAEHLATWRSVAADPPGRTLPLADVPALAVVEWADVAQTLR
ncbi:MAG: organomercurial lyase [Acidimicrobiales bacterium]